MSKKVLIICASGYRGNTLKIAIAISKVVDCEVVEIKEANRIKTHRLDLTDYQVIGFGSGIYFGQHEHILMDFIKNLPNGNQDAFIFSSRGNPFAYKKYHKPIKSLLTDKGFNVIGEFSCRGYDCTGPYVIVGGGNKGCPNENHIRRAERFIRKLLPQYKRTYDFYPLIQEKNKQETKAPNVYNIKHGNQTIKLVGDLVTVSHNYCSGCETCVNSCPCNVYSIESKRSVPTHEKMCIQCHICEDKCPHHAITIHGTWKTGFMAAFQDRN